MRRLAIVVLSLGVIGGFGSALHHMHHRGGCGYEQEGRWVPGHWEADAREVTAPVAAQAPAAVAAPAPIQQTAPQIIIVQPQQAPAAAAPTIVMQPAPTAPSTYVIQPPAAAAPKTEAARPAAAE